MCLAAVNSWREIPTRVRMFVCVSIYLYIYIYICVCVYSACTYVMCVYVCVYNCYECVLECMRVCAHAIVNINMQTPAYAYMYSRICACTYACNHQDTYLGSDQAYVRIHTCINIGTQTWIRYLDDCMHTCIHKCANTQYILVYV